MTDEQYKYDVAFSFLAQDELLAQQLNDELKDRLSTFLYSERQKELAGTDGEESFARVFRQEARTVVVLYRQGYGAAGWTRVESDAIRNRAHEKGYDFTLWVMLDKSQLPPWMPVRQLYYGLERFSIDGAVAVIETRVQEAGGDTRPLTFKDQAERASRNLREEQDRTKFLSSHEGVAAAQSAIATLHEELTQRVQLARDAGLKASISVESDLANVACERLSMTVDWVLRYSNSLSESGLTVKVWDGPLPGRLGGYTNTQRRPLVNRTFSFDRDHGEHGWSGDDDSGFLTTSRLADECMTLLFEEQPKTRR